MFQTDKAMPHDINLISTIAASLGLAMVLGFVAARLKIPPLVGYLLAGILIGPYTPGFVADIGLATQLAEIGVMLLMFGVGLHFSLGDLMAVKRIAVSGAIAQMLVATLLGLALATWWGWSFGAGLVFGLALILVFVGLKMLGDIVPGFNQLLDEKGKFPIGWSLGIIFGILAVTVVASFVFPKRVEVTPAGPGPDNQSPR